MHRTADAPDAGSLFQVAQDQRFLLSRDLSGFRVDSEGLVAGVAFGSLGARPGHAVFDDGFGLLAVRTSDSVDDHDKWYGFTRPFSTPQTTCPNTAAGSST